MNVLILYGSLKELSYSRFLAQNTEKVLKDLGATVRIFNPDGLPLLDACDETHDHVCALREAFIWSDAQVWVSPELHSGITAVIKNQLDWIPLTDSPNYTRGKPLALMQVSGGSQSFNTLNAMRIVARSLHMYAVPEQLSIPQAHLAFDDDGKMNDVYSERLKKMLTMFYGFSDWRISQS